MKKEEMTREEMEARVEAISNEIDELYKNHLTPENQDQWDQDFIWYKANVKPLRDEQDSLREKIAIYDKFNVKVGDGITISCWTDSYAYTVIKRTAKTITIQRDKAIRTDTNGMSDCQEYRYEPNPNGEIKTLYWSEQKGWVKGCYRGYLGRHEYYDYSF